MAPTHSGDMSTEQFLSAMASLSLTTTSQVLSSVKGVVSGPAPSGQLRHGHAGSPGSAVTYFSPTPLLTSVSTPFLTQYRVLLPQALCPPGRKKHHYSFHRGQSRLPMSCICLGCTALLTAMYKLVGTCSPSAPSRSPSPLWLSSSLSPTPPRAPCHSNC